MLTDANVTDVSDQTDLSRQRAVITSLMTITLHPLGRGARRDVDPATVTIEWLQPPAD